MRFCGAVKHHCLWKGRSSLRPPPYLAPPLRQLWYLFDPTVSQFREKTPSFSFQDMFLLHLGSRWMPGLEQGKRTELCSPFQCGSAQLPWKAGPSFLLDDDLQISFSNQQLIPSFIFFPVFINYINSQLYIRQETHQCLLAELRGSSSCCSNYGHSTKSCQTAPLKWNLNAGIFLTNHRIIIDPTTLLSALESQQNTDGKNVISCWNISSFMAAKTQTVVVMAP